MAEDEVNEWAADALDDEAADAPTGDDALPMAPDSENTGTVYTTPDEPEGGALVAADPIPDDTDPVVVPSTVTAVIRTVVPYLVGWIVTGIAWAATPLGVAIPAEFRGWLETTLPVVLGTLYLLAAKALEKRWPGVPWLGSTRRPLYTPPAAVGLRTAVATLASAGYVWWRGGRFTPAFRDSLVEADNLAPGFVLTQGGFNGTAVPASAGTHAGDSADFSVRGKTESEVAAFIEAQRKVGNFASFRTAKVGKWGVRPQGFTSYHVHVVPNGWGAPSGAAKRQVAYGDNRGYRHGRDGLASNGPDAGGPGHTAAYRLRTWWDYLKARTAAQKPSGGGQQVVASKGIPRVYTVRPWPRITVDGVRGTETIKRLQMGLNVKPTGQLDHFTVRALKVWLGNPDDGKGVLSPTNVRQLQYRVGLRGAAQDGQWGRVTTRKLQEWLNANR